MSYPKLTTAYVNGSPGGKSGSPLDGGNCTMCHGSGINSGPGSFNISSDVPTTGFISGETYTITIQGSHPPLTKYGFELTENLPELKLEGLTLQTLHKQNLQTTITLLLIKIQEH